MTTCSYLLSAIPQCKYLGTFYHECEDVEQAQQVYISLFLGGPLCGFGKRCLPPSFVYICFIWLCLASLIRYLFLCFFYFTCFIAHASEFQGDIDYNAGRYEE